MDFPVDPVMELGAPIISYAPSTDAWKNFSAWAADLVIRGGYREVCDVGGGANPSLPRSSLVADKVVCTLLDISTQELEKAPPGYRTMLQDIEAPDFHIDERFDAVICKMIAEHVCDGRRFHQNVFRLLRPGGIAIHYFPTLFALPFVANKLMPRALSDRLLELVAPRDRYRQGKFRAYYSWCYGPTPRMLQMLRRTGFEILEYRGLIGHIYFDRIPLLREIHHSLSRFLLLHPNPYLTSFAQVVLRKPVRA